MSFDTLYRYLLTTVASTALIFCYDFWGHREWGARSKNVSIFYKWTKRSSYNIMLQCRRWLNLLMQSNQMVFLFQAKMRYHIFKGLLCFFLAIYSCGVIGQWLFFKIARSNSILIKNSRLRRQSRSLPKMQSWWGWAITSLTFEVVTWNKWHEIQVCPLPWKMWKVFSIF